MQKHITAEENMALGENDKSLGVSREQETGALECIDQEEVWAEKWTRASVCHAKEFGLFL